MTLWLEIGWTVGGCDNPKCWHKAHFVRANWSGRSDSNARPLEPHSDAHALTRAI